MRKLYLHAGKHKTGTTSIQRYMLDNLKYFAEERISVVHSFPTSRNWALATNCTELAHGVLREELETPMRIVGHVNRLTYAEKKTKANAFNKRLHELGGECLIVSAEAFSWLRTAQEREVFDILFRGFDVVPVVFFRAADEWMVSWIKQTAPLYKKVDAGMIYVKSVFNYEADSWLLDDAKIRLFFQAGGRFLSYEEELDRYGSVVPAFLREVGLCLDSCPSWSNIWENRS